MTGSDKATASSIVDGPARFMTFLLAVYRGFGTSADSLYYARASLQGDRVEEGHTWHKSWVSVQRTIHLDWFLKSTSRGRSRGCSIAIRAFRSACGTRTTGPSPCAWSGET